MKILPTLLFFATFFTGISHAAEKKTTLTYYGHSAFKIMTPQGKSLVIDPWINNPLNPKTAAGPEAALNDVGPVDYILATHGHFDHISDAVALAKKTKARLVTNFELGQNMAKTLGYPADQMGMDTLGNLGGTLSLEKGDIKIHFVQAIHSSGLDTGKEKEPMVYGGNPVGFVIEIKNGPTIYHTGDTAYFSDMNLIGKQFHIDVALINIGGHFGMEPAEAAEAAKAVRAKMVIPHHFKTFPVLTTDASEFFKDLDKNKIKHQEMKPGSTITL